MFIVNSVIVRKASINFGSQFDPYPLKTNNTMYIKSLSYKHTNMIALSLVFVHKTNMSPLQILIKNVHEKCPVNLKYLPNN